MCGERICYTQWMYMLDRAQEMKCIHVCELNKFRTTQVWNLYVHTSLSRTVHCIFTDLLV